MLFRSFTCVAPCQLFPTEIIIYTSSRAISSQKQQMSGQSLRKPSGRRLQREGQPRGPPALARAGHRTGSGAGHLGARARVRDAPAGNKQAPRAQTGGSILGRDSESLLLPVTLPGAAAGDAAAAVAWRPGGRARVCARVCELLCAVRLTGCSPRHQPLHAGPRRPPSPPPDRKSTL